MRTMRLPLYLAFSTILIFGLLFGVWIGCEKKGGLGPPVTTARLIISSLTANPTTIQTGGQSSIITVVVTDSLGDPQAGLVVLFSTTLGTITSSATTDSAGTARATLTSGSTAGRAKITAALEGETIEEVVYVQIGEVTARITLEASALAVYANGVSSSLLMATVFDSTGMPQPGVAVAFQTTAGTLLQTIVYTGVDGIAATSLVAPASIGDLVATVTASIALGSSAKPEGAADAVSLSTGTKARVKGQRPSSGVKAQGDVIIVDPTAAKTAGSAWVTVVFIGVTMVTTADPTSIAADESEVSFISVNIKETTTNIPIPNAQVFFGTDLGTIEGSALTDISGVATAQLTSGTEDGPAHVRVFYGALVDTVVVLIEATTHTTMVFHLNATPTALDANGSSTSNITATLSDAENNNPVVGVIIHFKTSLGTITAMDTTDGLGAASATLTSARRNGRARVTASYASLSKEIEVRFKGVTLDVSANPNNLNADGQTASVITVTLKDAANLPIFGEPCLSSSVFGDLSKSRSSPGESSVLDTTDVNGEVILFLTSTQAGTDMIRSSAAGASDSITVNFTGYTFSVQAERPSITAGGETVTIVAELKNSLGVPEQGATVEFATTMGTITFSDVTDASGQARATLTSGSTSGTATVTAHAQTSEGPVSATTTVQIQAADPAKIALSVDPKVVAIGGGKSGTATLTALVLDSAVPGTGNPVADVTVAFTFVDNPGNGEYINPGTAVTDISGKAVTSFVSGTIPSDFEGIEIMATANGQVSSNIVKLTVAGAPDSVSVGYDTDSFTDNENGTYTLSVAAIVSDANGNPVVDGTWVYFSTTPNIGVVESPIQTDAGIASSHINYPASSVGDSISLIAESGGIEGMKRFRLPGPSGIAHAVRLDALNYTMLADGLAITTVDALVTDVFGRPVGGAMVTFSATAGRITLVAFTIADRTRDDYGIAHAVYTSGASYEDVTDKICATVAGGSKPDCIEIDLRGITLQTNVYPLAIPADGLSRSTVTTVVKETTSEFPIAFGTVSFGSKLGTVIGSDATDTRGVAISTLTSGTRVGMDTVVVSYGAILYDTAFVEFTAGDVSQIVIILAEPDSIGVRGVGYNESAELAFEVRDNRGRPINSDNPQLVQFEVNGIPTINPPQNMQPYVYPASVMTDDSARVQTTLNSGSKAGVVEVVARINGPTGVIRSTPVRISIHGGPPDQDHFSVVPRYSNIPGWRHYGVIDTITAYVGDRYGNPVPTGTAVYFTTTGGIIQGSSVTDPMGVAFVLLETASPLPYGNADDPTGRQANVGPYLFTTDINPDGDGIAAVFANTIDGEGDPLWAHTTVVFSGTSVISDVKIYDETGARIFSLNVGNGGFNTVEFRLRDYNGNPIARSMSNLDLIQVRECDDATVSEPLKSGLLMPDTRAGWTSFSFVVSDKDARESDPAKSCTVSIVVSSSNNGDVYYSISGQVD